MHNDCGAPKGVQRQESAPLLDVCGENERPLEAN
jgi:hypothetical protein